MTQDDSTICQTPIESVPVRVRVHGLADAHSRPLVAWGKVNGKHRGSWRTSLASSLSDFRRKSFVFNNGTFEGQKLCPLKSDT